MAVVSHTCPMLGIPTTGTFVKITEGSISLHMGNTLNLLKNVQNSRKSGGGRRGAGPKFVPFV